MEFVTSDSDDANSPGALFPRNWDKFEATLNDTFVDVEQWLGFIPAQWQDDPSDLEDSETDFLAALHEYRRALFDRATY